MAVHWRLEWCSSSCQLYSRPELARRDCSSRTRGGPVFSIARETKITDSLRPEQCVSSREAARRVCLRRNARPDSTRCIAGRQGLFALNEMLGVWQCAGCFCWFVNATRQVNNSEPSIRRCPSLSNVEREEAKVAHVLQMYAEAKRSIALFALLSILCLRLART